MWCRFRAVWKKKSTFRVQTSRKMWGLISRRAPTSISMGSFPSRGSASYRLIHRIQVSNNLRMSEPSRNGASIFLRAPRQTRKPCAKVRNKIRNSRVTSVGIVRKFILRHSPDKTLSGSSAAYTADATGRAFSTIKKFPDSASSFL